MDDTYQIYLNRVARMMLLETYLSGLQHIQESPKFQPTPAGDRQPVPFPGYTVTTPTWEDDSENTEFYTNLQNCQQHLLQQLDTGLWVPVPPESFHLTLADLIWDDAYRHASKNPEFEGQLREQIAQSFKQYESEVGGDAQVRWQILGIMLRTRALAVCLVPRDEDSYERIIKLRRAIYQNAGLIGLGIEQQYHFTPHVTLGYFGDVSPDVDRDRLSVLLHEYNQRWIDEEPHELRVRRAEIRKFDDMTRYYREPDWPAVEF
ncbi:DUF1868 domain-containing protein [Microcoleus sp. FACHB-68]|nr:DUF1868 domain-containing protein [Microcoleus sp. FACHB-68]MBD1938174.1 DUF1868 domain-containing protein [Microcoleus sp. FACHB-68]